MEKNLFTWKDWDHFGDLGISFSQCQMISDFGPIKKDQEFDWINMDIENSIIEFGMNDEIFTPICVKFRLVLDTTE